MEQQGRVRVEVLSSPRQPIDRGHHLKDAEDAPMFGVEYRRGMSACAKDVSAALDIEAALASAQQSAAEHRADNIVITDPEGCEIGVYPVNGVSLD